MTKLSIATLFVLLAAMASVCADSLSSAPVELGAFRLEEPIVLDGTLSEHVWHNGGALCEFIQKNPDEGQKPTEETEVRVAYDDDALYIGARMYDSAPDSIVARLARRDAEASSDYLAFFIDPYHDRRSGFYFGLDAAGTYYDGILYNDEWDDSSWDGVWQGKVRIDDKGWTAEMRIPYSQLRFQKKDEHVWGINFERGIHRKNEEDCIVFTPKDGSGFVSRFIDLVGVHHITAARQVEILPYSRMKAEYVPSEAGDPFNDGSRFLPGMGADCKIGIGNNLTLDAAFNPDFGQVEVDPAVVNLGDVETFYDEKRPFFLEGASIFEFGYGGSRSHWGFNWSGPDFLYSRRIGRSPQGSLPDFDYADVPEGTRILGATKLTGKVSGNWNIGTLHAITAREMAEIDTSGHEFETEVEPLAYYGVARAQKEINEGRQGLGFISTVSSRMFKDDRLRDEFNSGAGTFGVDGWTFLDSDKKWVISSWAGMSHIRGSANRMTAVQRSSRHYFQRPDARHVEVDSTATSMTGFAGRILLNKQKGNVLFNTALGVIDPRFDINDMGFMWRTDIINAHIGGGYKWTKPGKIFRYAQLIGAAFQTYDLDGNSTWRGIWQNGYFEFLNYWNLEYAVAGNPETISNSRTRGGPLTLNVPGYEVNLWANSDSRKQWIFGVGGYVYSCGTDNWCQQLATNVEWKPGTNVSVSINPQITRNKEYSQWVDAFDDPLATDTYGRRYVFAHMDQTELSAGIRLNWTFSPTLSLQFYGQPLISSGDFFGFKELARAKSYDFTPYNQENVSLSDGEYEIDPDGSGPAPSFGFSDPDFNYASLRGSAVLRWEYMPGSTLYLVWTQSRFDYENVGDFRFNHSMGRMWDTDAENIFMAKVSYWLSI